MKSKAIEDSELLAALNEVKVYYNRRIGRTIEILKIFKKNVDPAWYNLIQDYFYDKQDYFDNN